MQTCIDINNVSLKFAKREKILHEATCYVNYFKEMKNRPPESIAIMREHHKAIIESAKKKGLIEPGTEAQAKLYFGSIPLYPH